MSDIIQNLSSTYNVSLHRGDTHTIYIPIMKYDEGDASITYKEGYIYFGVMEPNIPFENSIIRKKYSYQDLTEDGILAIRLNPTDTECLYPGLYYYSIKTEKIWEDDMGEYDEVHTIISDSKFIIM